jgi:hypothetical protein
MSTWEERMTPRPTPEPRLDLVEVCWRVVGPSKKVIDCGIYRTAVGLEVRCAYSERVEDFLRSQFANEIGMAREIAEAWKHAAMAKGFQEAATSPLLHLKSSQ